MVRKSKSPRKHSVKPHKASRARKSPCPRGHILRSGYRRKAYVRADGTRVRATTVKSRCIKGRGAHPSRKGPKIIPKLKKGRMEGYHTYLSADERHAILTKLVNKYGYKAASGMLIAPMNFLKNSSPSKSAIFRRDHTWLKNKYRGKSNSRKSPRRGKA